VIATISPAMAVFSREWRPAPGAAPEEIDRLVQALPFTLPGDYVAFLRLTNGGEGEFALAPLWFQLFDVACAIEMWNSPHHRKYYPRHFFFGSNGGLESIAMDMTGVAPWPVVMLDLVAGLESSVTIAPSFTDFLSHVGVRSNSAA
jgi:hypothetical protein